MIKSFKHKGLEQLFEEGITKGLKQDLVKRLRKRLAVLDSAVSLDDIKAHNWGLHPLRGDLEGCHAIKVNGNWRLFFQFKDGNVYLLDYADYH